MRYKKSICTLIIFTTILFMGVEPRKAMAVDITPLSNAALFIEKTESMIREQKNNELIYEEPIVEEKYVQQVIDLDFDILQKSGYTRDELKQTLSSNNYKRMIPYLDTFIEAENEYGVNALYLMCQLGLESGWGKYRSGVNNIAGWTNGRGGYKNFDSVESCIMYVAYKLSTFYKNKVGTRLEDVCMLYCPNDGYADKVIRIMIERENEIKKDI